MSLTLLSLSVMVYGDTHLFRVPFLSDHTSTDSLLITGKENYSCSLSIGLCIQPSVAHILSSVPPVIVRFCGLTKLGYLRNSKVGEEEVA